MSHRHSVQEVIPNLFIGAQFCLLSWRKLLKRGITRILAVNGIPKPENLPLEFLSLPIDDVEEENITEYFEDAI
jgi:hypothetical protein